MITKEKFRFKINFRPLVVVFLSLLFGLITARQLYNGDGIFIALSVVVLGGIVLYAVLNKRVLLAALAVVIFFCGNGLFFLSHSSFMGKEFSNAEICGRVNDDGFLFIQENGQYRLTLERVTANGESVGNVDLRIYGAGQDFLKVGDILTFSGDLRHEKLFTLGNFNSSAYRSKVAYYASVDAKDLGLVSGGMEFDESARLKIKQTLYSNMSDRNAAIAFAALTGDKSDVLDSDQDTYRNAGIIHILTVSGLHIAFLIAFLSWILKLCRVNRFVNFSLIFVLLLVYAFICGFSPSVVRAMIMGLTFIAANLFYRDYDGPTTLAIAGLLTLIFSPLSALDIGFLMSYASVASIYLLHRPISQVLKTFLPFKVANAIAVSLATQIGLLPFFAYFFTTLNLLSFFVNLLVVPLFGVIFVMLFMLVILVMIIPPVGKILMLAEWGFVAINETAAFFAVTRFQIPLKPMDAITSALIYFIAFSVSCFVMTAASVRWLIVATLTLVFGLFTMIKPSLKYEGSSIAVLSRGEYNNCVVLETKSGQTACFGNTYGVLRQYLANVGEEKVDFFFGSGEKYSVTNVLSSSGFAGSFKYEIDEGIYKIEFDEYKILFTNATKKSYNQTKVKDLLESEKFDFVFINNFAEVECEKNFYLASYSPSKLSDFSLQQGGSFKVALADGKTWRLD